MELKILDSDIATIEALHDLLLDKHHYDINHITLQRSRKLTNKLYKMIDKSKPCYIKGKTDKCVNVGITRGCVGCAFY